jgi:hypothetical protein
LANKPFRREVFLLRALVGVFVCQFLIIGFAFIKCSNFIENKEEATILNTCPKLGGRAENLFGVATATVLSLLGTGRKE